MLLPHTHAPLPTPVGRRMCVRLHSLQVRVCIWACVCVGVLQQVAWLCIEVAIAPTTNNSTLATRVCGQPYAAHHSAMCAVKYDCMYGM